MHQSKLVRQLRILTPFELKRLLQFLKSPFYNANPAILKLYLLLRDHYPEFDAPVLGREKVFRKLFPGRAYDHQKLLNLMSGFTALLEQYLTLLQLEKNVLEQKKLLVQAYSERPDCYEVFEKKLWELDRFLDAQPYRDELYFREKKDLNLLYFGHPGTGMVAEGRDALQNALQHFETYKAISTAKLECSWNAWENAVGDRKAIRLEFSDIDAENPLLTLYKKLAALQRAPDAAENLEEIDELLNEHIRSFRPNDQSNILRILLNHYTRLLNMGRSEAADTILGLYKTGLAYDCFLEFGKIKESIFLNIVTAGSLCGEFEWTEMFIDEYQHMLPARSRADTLSMAKGQLHIEKREYLKATEVLQYAFSEPQDIVKARMLAIRAWFELYWNDEGYYDLLSAQLDAFEKYTRRNKVVTPRMLEGARKFIFYVRKLAILKLDDKNTSVIKPQIEAEPNVLLKKWLLNKI
ncbi:MAG: hypothetical protein R2791_00095 [Saprospiraceae bacterium]